MIKSYRFFPFSVYSHFFITIFFFTFGLFILFVIIVKIFDKRTWNTITRVVHDAVDTRRLMHAAVVDTVVDVDLTQSPLEAPGTRAGELFRRILANPPVLALVGEADLHDSISNQILQHRIC